MKTQDGKTQDAREDAEAAAHGLKQLLGELAIEAIETDNRRLLEWRIRPMQARCQQILDFLEGKEAAR